MPIRELAPDEEVLGADGKPLPSMSAGEVASKAASNFLPSLKQLGADTIQPLLHPIETAQNIYELGKGLIQLGIPGEQGSEDSARAVGAFFANRYGGLENIKQTLATDPAGLLADLATVVSGGGTVAARAPGMVGKIGRSIARAGEAIDPISGAAKLVKAGATTIPAAIIGTATGAGEHALTGAAEAGLRGGEVGKAFRENITGREAPANVVAKAEQQLDALKQERSDVYRANYAALGRDKTVLDIEPIREKLAKARQMATYKGKTLDPSATATWDELSAVIEDWATADPQEFWTPEGFDALKKRIGDIYQHTEQGSRSQAVAKTAYDAVKSEISAQAPIYADMMKAYEDASQEIMEIKRTLSLSPTATIDTKLRKLQSTLRKNANTNYGQRAELLDRLDKDGTISAALAGQQLQGLAPQGLARAFGGGAAAFGVTGNIPALAALPFTSPRLMGEAAYGIGVAARPASKAAQAYMQSPLGSVPMRGAGLGSFQAGRVSDEERMKNALRITIDRDARQ